MVSAGKKEMSKGWISEVVVQFDLSSRASLLCAARDLGEPRELSRFARQNKRAFGSLPDQTAPLPSRTERSDPVDFIFHQKCVAEA